MPGVNQSLFEEAYLAFQEGNPTRVREILARLIKSEPDNAQYWLLMSAAVENQKETLYCLQEVLKLDPHNPAARQGMVMLGKLPLQPDLVVPMAKQRNLWKLPSLIPVSPIKTKHKASPLRILLQVGVAVLFLAVGAYLYLRLNPGTVKNVIVLRSPLITEGPTPTFLPKNTLVYTTSMPDEGSPPPLSARLVATYTPAPPYVQTPHPIEAYSIGMRRMAARDYPAAILYFQQAVGLAPESPDLYYHLGEAYRLNLDAKNARQTYLDALEVSPRFAPAYLGLGLLEMDSSSPDMNAAVEYLMEAVSLDPGLTEARLKYAEIAIKQNDPDLAQKILEPLGGEDSISPGAHYLLGYASFLQGDLENAQLELERSLALDITNLEVYRLLGEIFTRQGQYADAIENLETVTLYEPENADALAWLGQAYYETGDDEKAMVILTKAIQKNTRNAKLYLIRGSLYLKEGDPEKAVADLNASLKLDKTKFETHLALSMAFLENDQPGNAYMQLSTAEAYYSTDEEHASLLYYRAQSLEQLDEILPAIRDWKAFLELPESSMPAAWRTYAQKRLETLSTPTSTPVTPTITFTRMPTRTNTVTFTRQPTLTKTLTLTRQPTLTFTTTPTLKPAATSTPSPTSTK